MGRFRDAWNALRGYAAAQDSRAYGPVVEACV